MRIEEGVYEALISRAIEGRLRELEGAGYYVRKEALDRADSYSILADYLASVVGRVLKGFKDNEDKISDQVKLINKVLKYIEEEWGTWGDNIDIEDDRLSDESEAKFLRGIYSTANLTEEQVKTKASTHPVSGYRVSNLFTGGGDLTIDQELRRDIATADQIDMVVSFIKHTGLRLICDNLKEFVQRPGTRLRVITTTYMGATDPKAVEQLMKLQAVGHGNVEIKASYNNKQERLHAKAYIFGRKNGFDTAYIGSSNLSHSALTKGLEWNMRVTNLENKHIIDKTRAAFENYWNSEDFEYIRTAEDLDRFKGAIYELREHKDDGEIQAFTRFEFKLHQQKVLDALKYEREVRGNYRNLVIAATGTGKTVMSAFDYKRCKEEWHGARLLFIAHREKILMQGLRTFRSVLRDNQFGELWTGKHKPHNDNDLQHLFITVQTLNNNWERVCSDLKYYDYIVVDEAHHGEAASYRKIFSLEPRVLLGLTATPERMDGGDIKKDFGDRFAAEIRLTEALEQQLLCPFDYFCVSDDSIDLRNVTCRGDKYDEGELEKLLCNNARRFEIIQEALDKYVTDPQNCKAVCFCSGIKHAEYMAKMFNDCGYKALAVTSVTDIDVERAAGMLAYGGVNYLCVADMLNEGVDIPEIDTVLFLRPTKSLTVYIQQLGRGLRLSFDKQCLTVLDFVAQANQSYNYESRFRALLGRTKRSVQDEIEAGFTFLPRGCSITMERLARDYILTNIKSAIFNLKRLKKEVGQFTRNTGRELTLDNFLDNFGLDIRQVLKSARSWTKLKAEAGVKTEGYDKDSKYIENLENGLARLYHINSYEFISYLERLVARGFKQVENPTTRERKFLKLLYITLWFNKVEKVNESYGTHFVNEAQAVESLNSMPWLVEELRTLLRVRKDELSKTTEWLKIDDETEIELHGCYSADEVHMLIRDRYNGRTVVQGTQFFEDKKLTFVFVTLNKSDKDYSPQTRYEDYAISNKQFHWQSMNNVKLESKEGQRIVNQQTNGWRYLLFVRDSKKDEWGFTNGYYCLGFVNFDSSTGERPINVVWNMQHEIPGFILEMAKVV